MSGSGADVLDLHEPGPGEARKQVPIATRKAQNKLSVLGLMVEKIARESRGERKARQT